MQQREGSRFGRFVSIGFIGVMVSFVVVSPRTAAADSETLRSPQVETAVEMCTHPVVTNGVTYRVAEHRFPRRVTASLARVSVLAPVPTWEPGSPPGYVLKKVEEGVFVKDGAVAVNCGTWNEPRYETVIFLLPRAYKLDLDPTEPW
jgi:hypothetical protein